MQSLKASHRLSLVSDYQADLHHNDYNEYYKDRPTTLEDRRAYGRMKNAVWALRSSCSALQR